IWRVFALFLFLEFVGAGSILFPSPRSVLQTCSASLYFCCSRSLRSVPSMGLVRAPSWYSRLSGTSARSSKLSKCIQHVCPIFVWIPERQHQHVLPIAMAGYSHLCAIYIGQDKKDTS